MQPALANSNDDTAMMRALAREAGGPVDTEAAPTGRIRAFGTTMRFWLPEGFTADDIGVKDVTTPDEAPF